MITDIPTADEFKVNGLAYLNLCWEYLYAVHREKTQLEEGIDLDEEYSEIEKAWDTHAKRARQKLSVAIARGQQGSEFLLKSKIAAVSPFLLLTGDWTRECRKIDQSFADFKTIDASDLVRAHDAVL